MNIGKRLRKIGQARANEMPEQKQLALSDATDWLGDWHPLAEQGDADAQFHLGVMYESGQGVLRNDAEAIKWYRKAAEQDDAVAQFNLGIMYTKGEGVSPNHAEAALWYRLAADHGLAGRSSISA